MGAGVSALPAKLDLTALKTVCGDKYDVSMYESMKGPDGLVLRQKVQDLQQVEVEARKVFASYFPSGHMNDTKVFFEFCKDLKWLDKKFTKGDAAMLFSKVKDMEGDAVTFDIFLKQIVNEVAVQRNIDVYSLVFKIASHTPPPAAVSPMDVTTAIDSSNASVSKGDGEEEERRLAATKLQSRARANKSVKDAKDLREVRCF